MNHCLKNKRLEVSSSIVAKTVRIVSYIRNAIVCLVEDVQVGCVRDWGVVCCRCMRMCRRLMSPTEWTSVWEMKRSGVPSLGPNSHYPPRPSHLFRWKVPPPLTDCVRCIKWDDYGSHLLNKFNLKYRCDRLNMKYCYCEVVRSYVFLMNENLSLTFLSILNTQLQST